MISNRDSCHELHFLRESSLQYVALSRCRRLEQLHLWCLDRSAIYADPNVSREYQRLAKRRLTSHHVQNAPTQQMSSLQAFSRIHLTGTGTHVPT